MKDKTDIHNERRQLLIGLGKTLAATLPVFGWPLPVKAVPHHKKTGGIMKLPRAKQTGMVAVEQAIAQRRTVRSYQSKPLSLEQLAQLMWAAQGITGKSGFKRAAPSAGALYPMDLYVVADGACVEDLEAGVYHYEPAGHMLSPISDKSLLRDVARASLSQMWMATAPVNLLITAEYRRIEGKYGSRGERYAMIEAGHIGQNIFLQAEALGLKAGILGAFQDGEINRVLDLPHTHEPLIIMPVGYG
ncbi:MAG: SagB/ThcOx family dehydrogenase [Desulfobacteraceae bacterium]|nr:MAG: SagB/ThcOx family dehydrogenase [Desulfobacteraceae bacterium]